MDLFLSALQLGGQANWQQLVVVIVLVGGLYAGGFVVLNRVIDYFWPSLRRPQMKPTRAVAAAAHGFAEQPLQGSNGTSASHSITAPAQVASVSVWDPPP
jgi:hypothetical protein